MRILTGGHAIWMGGWTTQVHHGRDIIAADSTTDGLVRGAAVLEVMRVVALPTGDAGEVMLPPAYALADGILHGDHRVMPPDEIDPDYLDQDGRPALLAALVALGASADETDAALATYGSALDPEGPCTRF